MLPSIDKDLISTFKNNLNRYGIDLNLYESKIILLIVFESIAFALKKNSGKILLAGLGSIQRKNLKSKNLVEFNLSNNFSNFLMK